MPLSQSRELSRDPEFTEHDEKLDLNFGYKLSPPGL
jgi:hypothetical protein